ncbi:hypothetical protein B0H13DRAFT_1892322 [Mycena leptocephala]|nr:hypothetical protein B0H13DRAFT_1892322 [Mycena leptocephala]
MSSTAIKGTIHYHCVGYDSADLSGSNRATGWGYWGIGRATDSGKYTLHTLLYGLLKPLKRGLNFAWNENRPEQSKRDLALLGQIAYFLQSRCILELQKFDQKSEIGCHINNAGKKGEQ